MEKVYMSYVKETPEMFKIKEETSIFKTAFLYNKKITLNNSIYETIESITNMSENKRIQMFVLDLNELSVFIEYELLSKGFQFVRTGRSIKNNQVFTLRNDIGTTYTMNIKLNDTTIEVIDINKIAMTKTENLYSIFGLDEVKIPKILNNKKEYREVNSKLITDIKLILKYLESERFTGELTGTSKSFKELKKSYEGNFKEDFPRISDELHIELLPAYKGGVVLATDKYLEKEVESISFDLNSSYIDSMKKVLPKGLPKILEGKYTGDKLFIQEFTADFKLKEGRIPFLQNEYFEKVHKTDDLYGSNLLLSSLDLELFFDNYEVYSINYIRSFEFESIENPFANFVDKYYNMKVKSKEIGDKIQEAIAKVKLNSCYGKFASRILYTQTVPSVEHNAVDVNYQLIDNKAKSQYLPLAIFISAYSRYKLIKTINLLTDNKISVIYSDTDSIYIEEEDDTLEKVLKLLEVSNTKLGAWKQQESGRIKVFGNKTYVFKNRETTEIEIKASGLSIIEDFNSLEDVYRGIEVKCKENKKVLGGVISQVVYKRLGKLSLEEFKKIFESGWEE